MKLLSPRVKMVFGFRCRKNEDYFQRMARFFDRSRVVLMSQKSLCLPKIRKVDFSKLSQIVHYRVIEMEAKKQLDQGLRRAFKGWVYKRLWLAEALFRYFQFCGFLSREKADILVVWNGHRWLQALMVLAAENESMAVAFAESGYFKNTFTLDPDGVNGCSKVPRETEFYRAHFFKNQVHLLQPIDSGNEGDSPYLLVPMQIEHDSQILLHSSWVKTMKSLIQEIVSASDDLPSDWRVLLKVHPAASDTYNQELRKLKLPPSFQVISGGDTQRLIRNSSGIITVNSTMGIEALELFKPVIVLGKANYAVPEAVLSAFNANELKDGINKVVEGWKPDATVLSAVLDFQKNEYHIVGDYRNINLKHVLAFSDRLERIASKTISWKS